MNRSGEWESARWRLLGLALLLLALVACGNRDLPPDAVATPAVLPTAAIEQRLLSPRYWTGGQVVSSQEDAALDMRVLGYEVPNAERLIVHVALYNNGDAELSFDPQTLLDQARLGWSGGTLEPQSVAVQRGNLERLPPRSGVVAHLTFQNPQEEQVEWQLPSFPPQPLDLSASPLSSPTTPPPLPDGLTRVDEPIVASFEIPDIGMQVMDMRVRGQEMSLTLSFINLKLESTTGGSSPYNGSAARLVDGQGIAYAPIEVEETLAQSIIPADEWVPGERLEGEIRFPRPTTGPVRLEFPTFPTLALRPGAAPPVALATATDYPPTDGSPVTIAAPPPVPNAALVAPVDYDGLAAFMVQVGQDMGSGNPSAVVQHFGGEARSQMETWAPNLARLQLSSPRFELQRGGAAAGIRLTGAEYYLFYHLVGDDPANEFILPVTLDLEYENQRWQITRWQSEPPLWSQSWGRTETSHFLLLADPSVADEADLLHAEAEVAFEAMAAKLAPIVPRTRYVMLVPATQERFTALTERGHETQGIASYRTIIRQDEIATTSMSFVLNGATLSQLPREERERTIAHELVHLLLAPVTRPYTPAWVTEGSATYFSEGVPWGTLRSWIAEGGHTPATFAALSGLDEFADWSDPDTVPVQYAYSAAIVAYLIERYGQAEFLTLYQGFTEPYNLDQYRTALDSPTRESDLVTLRSLTSEELLQRLPNLDIAAFEGQFEAWMLQQAAQNR